MLSKCISLATNYKKIELAKGTGGQLQKQQIWP